MLDMERMRKHLLDLGGTYMYNHARRSLVIAKKLAEKMKTDYIG